MEPFKPCMYCSQMPEVDWLRMSVQVVVSHKCEKVDYYEEGNFLRMAITQWNDCQVQKEPMEGNIDIMQITRSMSGR